MTEPSDPKPAPEPKPPARGNPLARPLLLAGLLGGLLGGLFGFALSRTFPAVPKPPPPPPKSEARQFADHVIDKLKEGKNDEFMKFLRPAFAQMTEEQFALFRKGVFDKRAEAAQIYGPGGEFEFCRESTLSPTLVRVTYLEKYARGCVMWSVVVYNSPEGWRMAACNVRTSESGYPDLQ